MITTAPLGVPGFRAAGVRCGIKKRGPDLALIAADQLATAAGLFTRSTVVGAPVEVSRERVRAGRVRGVVVNSSEEFMVGRQSMPHAVRVCLGATLSRERLTDGLQRLAHLLNEAPEPSLTVY